MKYMKKAGKILTELTEFLLGEKAGGGNGVAGTWAFPDGVWERGKAGGFRQEEQEGQEGQEGRVLTELPN